MKISRKFGLQRSQYELDFVDIDVTKDTPLFLDPYFISKMEFPFAEDAYRTLKNFFDYLLALLRAKRLVEAKKSTKEEKESILLLTIVRKPASFIVFGQTFHVDL